MNSKNFSPNKKLYSKRNFSDAIENLIPNYYLIEDRNEFGEGFDVLDSIINTHIKLASNITEVLSVPTGTIFSSIGSFQGISTFFIKNNNFGNLDKSSFEREVLLKFNKSFRDFSTSASFKSYVDETLIPELNDLRATPSSVDNYCYKLGWFFLLATDPHPTLPVTVNSSAIVSDYFVDRIYNNDSLTFVDGINAVTEYTWRNNTDYISPLFVSGQTQYVSGTQQLEKLKTLNSIIYSTDFFDRDDTYVEDSFDYFYQTGEYRANVVSEGAFFRLIRAFSFAFADQQNEADTLKTLYDLQDCPDEYLPEVAYLIGWKLAGHDRNKWRLQLANALSIYKKAGTKQSIQAAINNLFSPDTLNFESNFVDLWESYIPFLIYYALATESYLYKDFTTFTLDVALGLGITNYDEDNFDDNIKASVDHILLTLFTNHPSLFRLAGKPFPIDDEEFTFRYRNKTYPIPPFEEIPYYVTSEVNKPFIDEIENLLICFGVTAEFAAKVKDYIYDNTIGNLDDVSYNNSWLIFTTSKQDAPNWDNLTEITQNDKVKYLPLWSGKSSHYMVNVSIADYIFDDINYDADTRYGLIYLGRTAEEFSPAHTIPLVNAFTSATDDYDSITSNYFSEVIFDSDDYLTSLSGSNFSEKEVSGIDILVNGEVEFSSLGRYRLKSLYSPSASPDSTYSGVTFNTDNVVLAPRNTLRRKNLKNALNLFGYFDRTGFNPPVSRLARIEGFPVSGAFQDSALITRGLIPSSLEFASTSSICSGNLSSIPDVYKYCSINHANPYFGYYLSSTFPTRGSVNYFTDLNGSSMYQDRGQADPLMYLIYKIEQRKLEAEAYRDVLADPTRFNSESYWYNFSGSEANRRASCSETVLSSIDGYFNYSFGRKLHKLYYEYLTTFNYHPLVSFDYDENKSSILTHCFGSILKNSEFDLRGPIALSKNLFTSSIPNSNFLNLRSQLFLDLDEYNSYALSSSTNLVVAESGRPTFEVINSETVKDIDLIITSGTSVNNGFTIYDLQDVSLDSEERNQAAIKLKSVNGLPRLRFHVSGTDQSDTRGEFRANTFLSPGHKFSLTFEGLAALDRGTELVDAEVGVWIHTPVSNGVSYHYDVNGEWVAHTGTQINKQTVLDELTHTFSFDKKPVESLIYNCMTRNYDPVIDTPEATINQPALVFDSDLFSEKSINFNTIFGCGTLYTSSLHNLNQHYIIEVFMVPNRDNVDKHVILASISLRDDTLWDYTKIDLAGELIGPMYTEYCDPIQLPLTDLETRIVLKSFAGFGGKDRSTSFLSRVETQTSSIHLENGGSRLSHRLSPNWYAPTKNVSTNQIVNLDIL